MTVHHLGAKLVGVLVFVALGLLLLSVLYTGAGGRLPFRESYSVNVALPDAFQLVQNADVRRAGVKVGRVVDVKDRGTGALVRVEIDDAHAPIYRDATTLLRTKTLVGENYLELDPGHPRAGRVPPGGIVPLAQAGDAVELDEILTALDAPTRAAIRRNIDGLAGGVRGRSRDINELFASLRPATAAGADVSAVLAEERQDFAGLVRGTGTLTQAAAAQGRQLRGLVLAVRRTADAVASRDAALGRTVDELPAALRQVRNTVGRLQQFSATATPVLADVDRGVRGLEPAVAELPRAAARTRRAVDQLEPFLALADPLLTRLRSFSAALAPAVPALNEVLDQTGPALTYLRPYGRELGSFLAQQAAHGTYRDALGGGVRILSHLDADSVAATTPEMQAAINVLQDAGSVVADGPSVDENPYPKPGTVGMPQPFDGEYPLVTARPSGR